MFTQYEIEAVMKDYQQMRMQQRDEAIKAMLSQPEPAQRSRMKFRLPAFLLKWTQQQGCAKPLQECPELA